MMNVEELKLNLLYKGTRDGFRASDFHSRCDEKGPTICIIKSDNGNTFGGYTDLSWKQINTYIPGDSRSFIFQLD